MHTPRSDGFMELYLMPAPRWVEGYSCTALVSLPAECTGCESGRCRGFECLQITLMECGERHHWQPTTWLLDHTALQDSLGSPMAMLTVGLGEPVLGWQFYWAIVGQASGLGNLSCLDHTKLGGIQVCSVHMSVQVTGVSSVNRHRMGKTLL